MISTANQQIKIAVSAIRNIPFKKYRVLIQIVISFGCILWLFHSFETIGWDLIRQSMSRVTWEKIFFCIGFTLVLYASRLFRLRYWVEKLASVKISLWEWINLFLKSVAFGSLTPARLGDFSRIAMLENTGMNLLDRGKIILLDKLSDTFYIPAGIFLSAGIIAKKFEIPISWIMGVGFSGLIVYCLGMYRLGNFLKVRDLMIGWGFTCIGFCLFLFSNSFLLWGVGIELSLLEISAIIISVGVLASLPISIGGIGVRETSLISLLGLWGVPPEITPPALLFEFLLNIMLPVALYLLWFVTNLICRYSGTKNITH